MLRGAGRGVPSEPPVPSRGLTPEPSAARRPQPHDTRVSAGESCVTGSHSARSPREAGQGTLSPHLLTIWAFHLTPHSEPRESTAAAQRGFAAATALAPGPRPQPRRPGSPRGAPAGPQRPATSGTRSRRPRPGCGDPRAAITGGAA